MAARSKRHVVHDIMDINVNLTGTKICNSVVIGFGRNFCLAQIVCAQDVQMREVDLTMPLTVSNLYRETT